ncbi:SET domain-containing protein [Mycena leptocephala]|nr:SET domain-containing protein [Mycena leptocephala]
MASSITNHRFERRHGNVEKAGTMSTVFVHRTPSSSGSPKRKGKARENAKSLRLQTETNWSTLAQRCDGAAGITFVNDVDDEEIPPSLHGGAFAYLETNIIHLRPSPSRLIRASRSFPLLLGRSSDDSRAVNRESATPLSNPEGFPFCHCEERCDDLEECCQDNDVGYAYTDGLFNFTYEPDEVIVECNPYCNCPSTCGNRITQRPRCVPIEVFKTARCGWGVRAPIDVVRGTVLGVYTGKLIPREEAEALTGEAKQYCFDLDYNEMGAAPDELYSVDSYKHGNWTRFINHSCAPNLRVQPVVYDTLPEQRIAFLAFIATEHIPAGTEFTFDYDPEAQRAYDATVHRKGKQARAARRGRTSAYATVARQVSRMGEDVGSRGGI